MLALYTEVPEAVWCKLLLQMFSWHESRQIIFLDRFSIRDSVVIAYMSYFCIALMTDSVWGDLMQFVVNQSQYQLLSKKINPEWKSYGSVFFCMKVHYSRLKDSIRNMESCTQPEGNYKKRWQFSIITTLAMFTLFFDNMISRIMHGDCTKLKLFDLTRQFYMHCVSIKFASYFPHPNNSEWCIQSYSI